MAMYICGLMILLLGVAVLWSGWGRLKRIQMSNRTGSDWLVSSVVIGIGSVVGVGFVCLGLLCCYVEYTDVPRISKENIDGIPLVVTRVEHYQTLMNGERTRNTWLIYCRTSFKKGQAAEYGFTADSTSAAAVAAGDSARIYNAHRSIDDRRHPLHVDARGRVLSTDLAVIGAVSSQ